MYFDEEEKRCDRVTFTNRLIIEKKFEEWTLLTRKRCF